MSNYSQSFPCGCVGYAYDHGPRQGYIYELQHCRLHEAAPELLKQANAIVAWALKHNRANEGSELLEILSATQRIITQVEDGR